MLTIRMAALAVDLDMARARMEASVSEEIANAEWAELTDEQKSMFISIGVDREAPK